MNEPKPGSWIKPPTPAEPVPAPVKKPYVRKEHLTDRPFQHNEALQALRKETRAKAPRRPTKSTNKRYTKKEK